MKVVRGLASGSDWCVRGWRIDSIGRWTRLQHGKNATPWGAWELLFQCLAVLEKQTGLGVGEQAAGQRWAVRVLERCHNCDMRRFAR